MHLELPFPFVYRIQFFEFRLQQPPLLEVQPCLMMEVVRHSILTSLPQLKGVELMMVKVHLQEVQSIGILASRL